MTIQVKIFSPNVNTKLGLSFSIEIIAQLSVAVTVPVETRVAVQIPRSVSTVRSGGGIKSGLEGSLAVTSTVLETLKVRPLESVVETVTR